MNVMWVPMFEVPDIQVVAFAEGLKAAGLSSAAYFMCPTLAQAAMLRNQFARTHFGR